MAKKITPPNDLTLYLGRAYQGHTYHFGGSLTLSKRYSRWATCGCPIHSIGDDFIDLHLSDALKKIIESPYPPCAHPIKRIPGLIRKLDDKIEQETEADKFVELMIDN